MGPDDLTQLAVRALVTEACIAPKPGLVDRFDSGAHGDMDVFTFIDSSCSLFSYFRELAVFGMEYRGAPEGMLPLVRPIGVKAESTMLAATGGVNTQKGAIYSVGLLCLAAGRLVANASETDTSSPSAWFANGLPLDASDTDVSSPSVWFANGLPLDVSGTDALFDLCAVIASGGAPQGQDGRAPALPTGARGEAMRGFPSIRGHSLPVFKRLRGCGLTTEQAGVVALLHLIARVDDTNMIARTGLPALRRVQTEVLHMLETHEITKGDDYAPLFSYAQELNERFIRANMSPGGCADLLAATIFIDSLSR